MFELDRLKAVGEPLKLLAFDLDGTLLNHHGHVSGRNRAALDYARGQGVEVTLVTGRHISKVLPFVRELGLTAPFITSNGCELWSPTGELLERRALPQADRAWLHGWAAEHGLGYRAYCVGGVFDWRPMHSQAAVDRSFAAAAKAEAEALLQREWLKVLLADAVASAPPLARTAPRDIRGLYERLAADARFALAAYSDDPAHIRRIDVHPAGVDKAAGLQAVCRRIGVTAAQVAAFGDDTNDIAMLRWAGLGVAMEQAPAAVKEAASHIAPHHNRDGVAAVVHALLSAAHRSSRD
ncbi:HAD family hydrolase [Paenibacillus koleovorans]|uniref:HAD family hydrolase n=1 Tax=Paenibacillus koleovorans TaxID=121608 RepID=UPI000FD81DF0|nr:Cof-type HAD-IIB family hydrolase [Paenibacillus koleovorans]